MKLLSRNEVALLSPDAQADYLKLIRNYENMRKYNALNFFEPYEFQSNFYALGKDRPVRALIAANRVGKTYSAAMEIAMHLTGKYPEWWVGKRFNHAIKAVVCSVSASQVRDVLQKEFIGTENRDLTDKIGTGAIPKSDINVELSNKGRDGAFSEVYVKHLSGDHSSLKFFAYSQGMEPMQGFVAHVAYVDEQDKNNFDLIFSELVKRTATVDGLTMATFTPLQGVTHIVNQFWDPDGPFHKGLVNAGWDDVNHLTDTMKENMLAATPPHLREAVTKGVPVLGAGAVFNIGEDQIVYDDIEVGEHWPKICAVDVGFTNDPTAGIFLAKDPSSGIYYIYDEYGDLDNNTWNSSQHVGYLHAKNCTEIPIVYDSAAAAKVGAVGKSVADMWREMGLNVLPESFKNPQWLNEGTGSYKAISPGLNRMFELMATDKLKVHRKCSNWWREFRKYSYDDKGVPSVKDNHWMDASRYAVMSGERGLMQVIGNDWFDSYNDNSYFQSWD